MTNKNTPQDSSRRRFLKNISSSVVGAYIVPPVIKKNSDVITESISDAIEGKTHFQATINGQHVKLNIEPSKTLVELLRDNLKLTGTKITCNQGECGSCTVLVDDKPIYSCHILALDVVNKKITTIEGILNGEELSNVQKSFVEKDGLQCGFCTPGQIMSAYALVKSNPNASDNEIKEALSGNLCRCAAYPKIFDSVKSALQNNL